MVRELQLCLATAIYLAPVNQLYQKQSIPAAKRQSFLKKTVFSNSFAIEMVITSDINQHVAAVLETMGWPDDAFVPIANEENRQLMESIEQQMEAKQMKIRHRDQLNERVKLLRDHHRNAEAAIIENLVMIIIFFLEMARKTTNLFYFVIRN